MKKYVKMHLSREWNEDDMNYCLQLLPHANIRYREALVNLGQAELHCLLYAIGVDAVVRSCTIGGASFLTFDSNELPDSALRVLRRHSAALLLCQRQGEFLRPLEVATTAYLTDDLPEVLKYKGKTSTTFTRMMLNCAQAASCFRLEQTPLTVLDPLCGKATTCFCALERGWNAVGCDVDAAALEEADRYMAKHLQLHRLKHRRQQLSQTVKGRGVPCTLYTLADTHEHFAQGDTRSLQLCLADTAQVDVFCRKAPAHLLVADLPYGVQHAPVHGRQTESFPQLLRRALSAWYRSLHSGGAMALSFNVLTLPRATLLHLLAEAGFTPLTEPPYQSFEHFVEQAVTRDMVIAVKDGKQKVAPISL